MKPAPVQKHGTEKRSDESARTDVVQDARVRVKQWNNRQFAQRPLEPSRSQLELPQKQQHVHRNNCHRGRRKAAGRNIVAQGQHGEFLTVRIPELKPNRRGEPTRIKTLDKRPCSVFHQTVNRSMDDTHSLLAQRKAKLAALRSRGIDPFKNKFAPRETCAEARARYAEGREVALAGRI